MDEKANVSFSSKTPTALGQYETKVLLYPDSLCILGKGKICGISGETVDRGID